MFSEDAPTTAKLSYELSEVQLRYETKVPPSKRPKIGCSKDGYEVLKANWSDDMELCESFNILMVNKANKVVGIYKMSKGGLSGTVVDLKLLFAAAIKSMAAGIILAHNHPSGSLQPSNADIELTKRVCQAGKILDISVLDHIILSPFGRYYSFADEGMIS